MIFYKTPLLKRRWLVLNALIFSWFAKHRVLKSGIGLPELFNTIKFRQKILKLLFTGYVILCMHFIPMRLINKNTQDIPNPSLKEIRKRLGHHIYERFTSH